ncbi:CDP-diacylglycerol--glycerol-3-phosphate 3-phosphatidyltransferase [Algicola sagamiensis]|uniref:CDP-diacylglycerol--glycerol-3-phosphate 3-phosphatidyltransferase n=1 Tax=Algicola sagamiensis TaxID=163869 RepID=UPI0003827066|nr:CDP-diacylglycerol--glycerol-3-phosphate 3-phosphatidyltransferase [Algicola sagamiensis]
MKWNIPNVLTTFRLILIPVFLLFYYLPVSWNHFAAAFVFWLAAITDYFDGYLARKLGQSTPFGAFIDPVADKLMVTCALVVLVEDFNAIWITLPAIVIIGREVVISALREWMAERNKRATVAVSDVGKYKTAAQMLAIMGILWQPNDMIVGVGAFLLYIAVVLTFWSMFTYLKAAKNELFAADNEAK